MSATPKQARQAGQDDFARMRASMAVARRIGRYYEPRPLEELDALLAAYDEARRRGDGGT